MRYVVGIFIVFSLMMSGCSIPFFGTKSETKLEVQEKKQNPLEKIVLSDWDIVERAYTIIGDIRVEESSWNPFRSTKEALQQKLREEALKIGADGVIFIVYGPVKKTWYQKEGMQAKGKAIRFAY